MFSKISVFVDDIEVGQVGTNETFEVDVSKGLHAVHVQLENCKSPPYVARFDEGALIALKCTPPSLPFAVFSIFVNPAKFFSLEEIRAYPS